MVYITEVAYGEAIPEYIYEPTGEGEVFVGWIGETYDTMPAHDVTYTANIDNAIDQAIVDDTAWIIYDLTGRKLNVDSLNELSEGIYIVNGRKVMIK